MGHAGLPGTETGEGNRGAPDRNGAAGRCGVCDVSQQEATRIPALPRGRYDFAAGAGSEDNFSGAETVSEPGNPGTVWKIPHHEVVREPRPVARNTLHQVRRQKIHSVID